MDCGTYVVGGPASAFRSGIDGYADFAGEVAIGVASPAIIAGAVAVEAASSLADLAGSGAGGTMNLTVLICERTEDVTLCCSGLFGR